MRLIERMYAMINKELKLDWKEVPGPTSNSRIAKAFKEVIIDNWRNREIDDGAIATCSILMNWLCQQCGGVGTRSATARSWLDWGKESTGKEGDLVVLKRGNSSWKGHVTMLRKKGLVFVECVGFNQNNELNVSKYLRANVLGYRTSKD